ncbi:unnamed protein product [Callosobruchus maculatus]|uniref:Uncharacterized protein n=1 Tax=Callosobruchus maculatus TaxID=64391 RepID=A0A653BTH1_CALMS|nr:unnamed protein product [Callosobruchus maculatus]
MEESIPDIDRRFLGRHCSVYYLAETVFCESEYKKITRSTIHPSLVTCHDVLHTMRLSR